MPPMSRQDREYLARRAFYASLGLRPTRHPVKMIYFVSSIHDPQHDHPLLQYLDIPVILEMNLTCLAPCSPHLVARGLDGLSVEISHDFASNPEAKEAWEVACRIIESRLMDLGAGGRRPGHVAVVVRSKLGRHRSVAMVRWLTSVFKEKYTVREVHEVLGRQFWRGSGFDDECMKEHGRRWST
ncbi:hypothetical protein H2201_002053 [Coniosporium apollinis]|uniref:RapZ C-terminal domain-containing protein n=2 Tax=Coniosporium TaxID=2810619 RepID=A0ABQ9P657_9PEZI|nr:hypothetical protein H2199_000885 [Cladosporium sp. JES 115]KAJ9667867.1 hypothetical protein H2201_002053 [Coniosporium apollinis]